MNMNTLPDDTSHGKIHTRFELPDKILADRRPTLLKYAAHLRARGKDFGQIHQALLIANEERCSPPFTDGRGLKDIERIAVWASSKSAGVSEESTLSNTDRQTIEKALAFIDAFPWRGVASNNARVVALIVLKKMIDVGRLKEIGFSCRNMGPEVGLSANAASAALRRLTGKEKRDDVPVLFLCTQQKGVTQDASQLSVKALAYEYSLNEGAISVHTISHTSIVVSCTDFAPCLAVISHDAFLMRGQGLRRSYGFVYASLPCRTAEEIKERTHLSLRTVKAALASLKAEGLVEKDEKTGLWTRTCETLDQVAERRGTAGAGEKQKRLHALQRESYSAWLMRPRSRRNGNVYRLRDEASVPAPNWEPEIEWKRAA
jgi:hypothetical protein